MIQKFSLPQETFFTNPKFFYCIIENYHSFESEYSPILIKAGDVVYKAIHDAKSMASYKVINNAILFLKKESPVELRILKSGLLFFTLS